VKPPSAWSMSEEPYNGRGCVVAYRGVWGCGCQMHASWCIVGANPLHTLFLLPVSYNWDQVQFWDSFLLCPAFLLSWSRGLLESNCFVVLLSGRSEIWFWAWCNNN
jgi:hypothetical protein